MSGTKGAKDGFREICGMSTPCSCTISNAVVITDPLKNNMDCTTPRLAHPPLTSITGDAPHDKKMCSAIMSQKASRRPSFDLRLHWLGVSSQNMQHLRWSAVEVGGLGSVWVLSRGAPHQGQEGPPENLFCSVGVKVNFWPCGCPKSAARPASATS